MSTLKVDTYLTRGGASEIAIDKLKGVTAAGSMLVVGEGGTTTTNLQQGLCKSWIDVNQGSAGTGQTINDSFNVTSVTDTAAGQTTVTIANDMASANYCATSGSNQVTTAYNHGVFSTGVYRMDALNGSNADTDSDYVGTAIHGDLA